MSTSRNDICKWNIRSSVYYLQRGVILVLSMMKANQISKQVGERERRKKGGKKWKNAKNKYIYIYVCVRVCVCIERERKLGCLVLLVLLGVRENEFERAPCSWHLGNEIFGRDSTRTLTPADSARVTIMWNLSTVMLLYAASSTLTTISGHLIF